MHIYDLPTPKTASMDRTERFHLIDQLLNNNRSVTREKFLEVLEVSPATFKRDLEYLRDRLGAPIIWDRELRGYCYQVGDNEDAFQLPGLWFNNTEIQALLTMEALLDNLQPGTLSEHVAPLRSRIRMLLDSGDHDVEQISRRIRITPQAAKEYSAAVFETVCQALLNRKQLFVEYYGRQTDEVTARNLSPQRLVYYRDNWYLDAWCHLREGLRSFSLDAMRTVRAESETSIEVDEKTLNQELESGYGIFSGKADKWALLRFKPSLSRWISRETWHPEQQGDFDEVGRYLLKIPYHQDTELQMDILKYGASVEVLEPPELRERIRQRIHSMSEIYS